MNSSKSYAFNIDLFYQTQTNTRSNGVLYIYSKLPFHQNGENNLNPSGTRTEKLKLRLLLEAERYFRSADSWLTNEIFLRKNALKNTKMKSLSNSKGNFWAQDVMTTHVDGMEVESLPEQEVKTENVSTPHYLRKTSKKKISWRRSSLLLEQD